MWWRGGWWLGKVEEARERFEVSSKINHAREPTGLYKVRSHDEQRDAGHLRGVHDVHPAAAGAGDGIPGVQGDRVNLVGVLYRGSERAGGSAGRDEACAGGNAGAGGVGERDWDSDWDA